MLVMSIFLNEPTNPTTDSDLTEEYCPVVEAEFLLCVYIKTNILSPTCIVLLVSFRVVFVSNFFTRIPCIVMKGLSPFSVCCLLRINVHYVLLICILQHELN